MKLLSKRLPAGLVALALALPAGVANAEQPSGAPAPAGPAKKAAEKNKELKAELKEKREELKEKREELKEKREELKEKRQELKDELKDRAAAEGDDAGEARQKRREELRDKWAKLRETRAERRKERREELKKKWGELTDKPAVRAELKTHAWRMARLNRVRAVAAAEGKDAVVARVDKLIQKEKDRHAKHMDVLKSKGGQE